MLYSAVTCLSIACLELGWLCLSFLIWLCIGVVCILLYNIVKYYLSKYCKSLYSMMLILAFFLSFFLDVPQELQVLGIPSAHAVQQYQDQLGHPGGKGKSDTTSNTPHNSLYQVAHTLLSTSNVSNSPRNTRDDNQEFQYGDTTTTTTTTSNGLTLKEFPVPLGSHPHDVAPSSSSDGGGSSSVVWYTAQAMGELGKLDTSTGKTRHIL